MAEDATPAYALASQYPWPGCFELDVTDHVDRHLVGCDLGRVEGCGLDDVDGHDFDLVINATAASLAGEVPALPAGVISTGTWCYDMMYGNEPTAFMHWASELEAAVTMDGLGMLEEQAAESFRLWRGVRPDTAPVIRTLRMAQEQ